MKNSLTDRKNQSEDPDVKVMVFTHLTRPPIENLLNRCARIYMEGFNQAPWDIYEYNYTAGKAREEFAELASTVLSSGGALISIMHRGRPAGFSVVTSLDLFVREIKKVKEYPVLPPEYKNLGPYFKKLSQLLKISLGEFETIGYVVDVVVDTRYRGKGYGKELILTSLKYLKDDGKKFAMAWTVNPAMANILSQVDFKLINGIGHKGEGIDFTVRNREWFPTLVLPARRKTFQKIAPVVAQHYFKVL
jgi:ribosomal protein S18 acetylase RimI-like enzyme